MWLCHNITIILLTICSSNIEVDDHLKVLRSYCFLKNDQQSYWKMYSIYYHMNVLNHAENIICIYDKKPKGFIVLMLIGDEIAVSCSLFMLPNNRL